MSHVPHRTGWATCGSPERRAALLLSHVPSQAARGSRQRLAALLSRIGWEALAWWATRGSRQRLVALLTVAGLVASATVLTGARVSLPPAPTAAPADVGFRTVGAPDWLRPSQGGGMGAAGSSAVGNSSGQVVTPNWVTSVQDTPLWSGSDDRAIQFGVVPGGSYLRPMGAYTGGRLLVFYAGDGATRTAGEAWVDTGAVEPSGPPPWLATSDDADRLALRPLAIGPARVSPAPPPPISARYVAVVDDASGQLLYGNGQNVRVPPASTTKIATTIVALERASNLNQIVTANVSSSAMAAADGSSVMGLEPGERVQLRTLLYGMMLPSGNDAAEQTAISLGGSRARYLQWMNERVVSLGLRDTHFVTPSGMDAPGHYSSAYDMAMLARYAMRNEAFQAMAGAHSYVGDGYAFSNLNRLLGWYPGADGVKVGFTDAARKTFVASATLDGRRVFVSLMRSEDLPSDSTAMFDWVWHSFSWT